MSKKLLEVEWAGDVTDEEAEYIAASLSKSERLRKVWQRGRQRLRRKVTRAMVKRMVEEQRERGFADEAV